MYNSSNHPVFTYESLKGRELNREEDRIWRINEKSMKKKKIEAISFLVVLFLIITVFLNYTWTFWFVFTYHLLEG